MQLSTFKMTSEKNKLDKTLTDEVQYTGTLKESTSILNPVILVQAESVSGNYARIPDFGRYYFITDIISVRTGLWEVHMAVDVLTTYAASIKEQTAVIERQENKYNLWLNDPEFTIYNYGNVRTLQWPNGFNDNQEFILAVAGGAHEVSQ